MNGERESGLEETLIRQTREGDLESFGKLVDEYGKQIYALSFQFLGNHADAEDMVQEAFIRAYRNLENFRGDSTFHTWLYQIALNLCSNHRKKNQRLIYMSKRSLSALNRRNNGTPEGNPRQLVETRDIVRNAMASLQPHLRRAIFLVAGKSLSHREAAEIEGCSEGTISWRVFKARQRLREKSGD